jgi:hypothetical protein
MTITATPEQIPEIVAQAKSMAYQVADKFFREKLGGRDQYACGFASLKVYGVKGNTKMGKALIKAGFRKSYDKSLELWNPSGLGCQNVDVKEAGAEAAANVFQQYGFSAYSWSRLD